MLWQCMSKALLQTFGSSALDADAMIRQQDDLGQSILDACAVLDVNLPNLKGTLCDKVVELLPALTLAIKASMPSSVRPQRSVFAVVASCLTEVALKHVVEQVVPLSVTPPPSPIARCRRVDLPHRPATRSQDSALCHLPHRPNSWSNE